MHQRGELDMERRVRRREFIKGLGGGIAVGLITAGGLAYAFPREIRIKIPGPTVTEKFTKTKILTKTVTEFATELTETTAVKTVIKMPIVPELMQIFKQLIPDAAEFKPVMKDDIVMFFEAYDEQGALIGYTFLSQEMGYNAPIVVAGAIDLEYRIIDVAVIKHSETPKIGDRIQTDRNFLKQFKGLTVEELKLSTEGGKVDAITGVTISSKAVVDAIRKKLEEIIAETSK